MGEPTQLGPAENSAGREAFTVSVVKEGSHLRQKRGCQRRGARNPLHDPLRALNRPPLRGGPCAMVGAAKTVPSRSDQQALMMTILAFAATIAATLSLSVKLPLTPQSKGHLEGLWVCFFVVAIPHVWYVRLWRAPQHWKSRCAKKGLDPSKEMARYAMCLKAAQFVAFILWVSSVTSIKRLVQHIKHMLTHVDNGIFLPALALLLVGQALNLGSFRAIKVEGIYYGVKFGKPIPWCSTWPYGGLVSVPHPQYVGS